MCQQTYDRLPATTGDECGDGIRASRTLRATECLEVERGGVDEGTPPAAPADAARCHRRMSAVERVLATNLVGDERLLRLYRRACRAGDGPDDVDDGGLAAVKLVKLWALALTGIVFLHGFARRMGWEIDEDYALGDFVRYDLAAALLDLLFFFVVGRLHDASCRGVDRLFPWGIFAALGMVYPSLANDFEFLRHSVTVYDVMCSWPPVLFAYASALAALAVAFGAALVRSHRRRNVLRSRLVEAAALLCLFGLLPARASDAFHLHHWFGMWWAGTMSNAPEWWSRAFQAYALGAYVNGIAVYGRDPVLGCKYAFYLSEDLRCPYLQCYEAQTPENGTSGSDDGVYKDFVAPDWRICNAEELGTYT